MMAGKSKIEWTDATWNPVTGCSKVSAGCKNCYAKREWPRLSHPNGPYAGRKFEDVACHPKRLEIPLHWAKPRRVFVNSMSDLFHEAVPDDFIDRVFAVMALTPQHTFQILTKRTERMREYLSCLAKSIKPLEDVAREFGYTFKFQWEGEEHSTLPWPLPNVWLGVSVEDQKTADERVLVLLQTPAAVRFVSYEPALGGVSFRWMCGDKFRDLDGRSTQYDALNRLDWIICGGESGPGARPMHPDWARAVRDQCAAAGVAFFFKQFGEWGPNRPEHVNGFQRVNDFPMYRVGKKTAGRLLDGREWNEYPLERSKL